VSHACVVLLRALADRTGLTGGLSGALARRGFVPVPDRGRVLADLAVAIADDATVISDFAVCSQHGSTRCPNRQRRQASGSSQGRSCPRITDRSS
jgi:hypothetical protein